MAAPIVITARVGEQGRLYGSVTSGDIAEEVSKLVGQEVDRHLVVLEEPIKTLGTYEIPLRLTRNVEATVTVEVVGEGVAAEEAEAMAEGAVEEETEETQEEAEEAEVVREGLAVEETEAAGEDAAAEDIEETPEEAEEES
jgi:large subunit ribosomal protein L9